MGIHRPAVQLFGGGVIFAAAALLAAALPGGVIGSGYAPALAFAFAVALVVAKRFPLHAAPRTKVTLDTTVLFAAALLFTPAVAMVIAAAGTLTAQALRRQSYFQALFNAAQATLRTGVAAMLLTLANWDGARISFMRPAQLLLIAVAAVTMYVLDVLIVQIMVALQRGLEPVLIWRQALRMIGPEEFAQLALGVLVAAVVDAFLWALPLFLFPLLAIHRALERQTRLREQTSGSLAALAKIVDLRDHYTAEHSHRVAMVARELAVALRLAPEEVDLVEQAGRVHDVGKITVDPTILAKETRLTAAEWEQMKSHPATGAEILNQFAQFARAAEYVRHHHEHIDGTGYPDGLCGEAIPLGARILTVADAFDAMVSHRPYRPALALESVVAEFTAQRGRQWDDRVVAALLTLVAAGRLPLAQEPACQAGTAAAFVPVTTGTPQAVR